MDECCGERSTWEPLVELETTTPTNTLTRFRLPSTEVLVLIMQPVTVFPQLPLNDIVLPKRPPKAESIRPRAQHLSPSMRNSNLPTFPASNRAPPRARLSAVDLADDGGRERGEPVCVAMRCFPSSRFCLGRASILVDRQYLVWMSAALADT